MKPVQGETQAASEPNGLVWRLDSDLQIVSYQKELMTLCEFMKKLATENGLGWVDLENHVVTQKFHAAVVAWVGFTFVGWVRFTLRTALMYISQQALDA